MSAATRFELVPISISLDRMLLERRMTLTELAERVDITLANLSVLKTGRSRAIRLSTLEAICRILQCQPGDLLSYEPLPVPVPFPREPADDATGFT